MKIDIPQALIVVAAMALAGLFMYQHPDRAFEVMTQLMPTIMTALRGKVLDGKAAD